MGLGRCAAVLFGSFRAPITAPLCVALALAGCSRGAEQGSDTCSRQNPVGTQVALDAARAELGRRMRVEGIPEAKDPSFYFRPDCCSVETVRHSMLVRAMAGNVYATHYIVTLRLRNIPRHPHHVTKYSVNSCGKITDTF